MGRLVDLADLLDANEVADLLGLASRKVVAANRSGGIGTWGAFPAPVIDRRPCLFWLRTEVEAWDSERKQNPRRSGPKPKSVSD